MLGIYLDDILDSLPIQKIVCFPSHHFPFLNAFVVTGMQASILLVWCFMECFEFEKLIFS